ncbi:hypothetical protein R1flu_003020 [Riccia fluitans]|uniref:Zinc finger LSD1-type domain-containing protein n=1 Tax=Riccia fluitans TaxID=41844 RepID=A0ABD1Y7T8_9MARC
MSGTLIPYPSQQSVPNTGQQCQLICGGCRTLLVYPYGSNHVRCALCSFVTGVPAQGTQAAHINCGGCGVTLMYPAGAHAVKCAFCQYITCLAPATQGTVQTQTVIVENPMTIDETGQLVSSMAVGITTKRS